MAVCGQFALVSGIGCIKYERTGRNAELTSQVVEPAESSHLTAADH
jgi:hypothetical protein